VYRYEEQKKRAILLNYKIFFILFKKTILDRIHKVVNEKINQSSFFRRQLFHLAYKIKVKRLEVGLESPYLNK